MADYPILYAERLAAGEAPDAGCLAWLAVGFRRFLRGEGPSDVCLQITMGNRKAARNDALRRAAQIIDAGQGQSAWHLAELVRQAIQRFQTVIIQRIQRGDAGALNALDAAMRDAFATGAPPLTSRQRIYDALANSPNTESGE